MFSLNHTGRNLSKEVCEKNLIPSVVCGIDIIRPPRRLFGIEISFNYR